MPGLVHPRDGLPRSVKSAAEVKVYEALRARLPEGWTAWHSLRLRVDHRWEGEGDFVVAIPRRGLLVVEVKGGRVECQGGRWLQNGKPTADPRAQSRAFVRELVAALRQRGVDAPPFGDAVAFPDCDFSDGPHAGDLAGLVLGARDLAWLDGALKEVVGRALPERPLPPTTAWVDALHELWGETWVPEVRLGDQVEDAARRAIKLTEEQLGILDCLGGNRRLLVEGAAGTGKTILARELCGRFAAAGQRVLYLCFTDAIARVVNESLAAARRGGASVRATTIRRYACELLEAAGRLCDRARPGFWGEVALEAACCALPDEATRPEVILVDEAQDPDEGDWTLVEALAGPGSTLWMFGDERQRFWTERAIPAALLDGAARYRLMAQHRNPPAVEAFAALYAGAAAAEAPTTAIDPAVLKLVTTPHHDLLAVVGRELDALERRGARPQDVAVVSLAGQTKSDLLQRPELTRHQLVRADAADAATHTVADTFLRFKGLDRPFVIVTELVHGPSMKYDTRMHIALTRATVGAVIVCPEELLGFDERLRRLVGPAAG